MDPENPQKKTPGTEGESAHNPQPNTGDNVRASWRWSLHDVRTHMSHCTPDHKQALIDCFLWCIDPRHPVTLDEFCVAVGYDKSTVTRIYMGRYVKHGTGVRLDIPAKMAQAAREFLARQKMAFRGRDEFVMTPTAKRIWTGCDLARESHTPVWILGPSHIGKTWALENYSTQNNHGASPYVRMKAASGLHGMVARICERVGVSTNSNTANQTAYLKRAITPDMVLILDELHLLALTYRLGSFFACIEMIRELYDETGCGMVLCGTMLLFDKIKGGQHGELEQIVRRGVHRILLPGMPTKGDLTMILDKQGLEFPSRKLTVTIHGVIEKPYEILRQTAKDEGLKAVCERIRYGAKIARRDNADLNWSHFAEAHLRIASSATPEADWN